MDQISERITNYVVTAVLWVALSVSIFGALYKWYWFASEAMGTPKNIAHIFISVVGISAIAIAISYAKEIVQVLTDTLCNAIFHK